MRKPRVTTIGDIAARTDAGRHIVCSVGTLDGPFLAALQRLQVAVGDGEESTWADGIGASNRHSDMPDELTKLPYSKPISSPNRPSHIPQEGEN